MRERILGILGFFVLAGALLGVAGCQTSPRGPDEEPRTDHRNAGGLAEATHEEPPRGESPRLVRLEPFPGVVVFPERQVVELTGEVCLDRGWLEQVACAPGTREHESLVVPDARPSHVHAALLAAGFEAGSPGLWTYEDGEYDFVPPTGSQVQVHVRYTNAQGERVEEPIRNWIRVRRGAESQPFPDDPWIFGGSSFERNREWMGPGEHYVADISGSIIGIVTFGDEVLGFSRVFADQASVQPPEWEAATDRMPPVGTEVTLVILPAEND